MRVGLIPETFVEWLGSTVNAIPSPIFDTMFACLNARAIMVGVETGVFDALEEKPLTAKTIARICGLHRTGTERLLNCLVAGGHLQTEGIHYALTSGTRLLKMERADPEDTVGELFISGGFVALMCDEFLAYRSTAFFCAVQPIGQVIDKIYATQKASAETHTLDEFPRRVAGNHEGVLGNLSS